MNERSEVERRLDRSLKPSFNKKNDYVNLAFVVSGGWEELGAFREEVIKLLRNHPRLRVRYERRSTAFLWVTEKPEGERGQ